MMKAKIVWLLLVMLMLGCAAVGLPVAKTFDQRLAVGYSNATTAVKGTTILLRAKKISADDAENVVKQADLGKQGLDIARRLYALDPLAGEAKLSSAIAVLSALQAYVDAKEK